MRRALARIIHEINKPRVYKARHGLARGLKQIGGIGLVLPSFLRGAEEYPEFAGREEALLRTLVLRGKTIYDVGAFEGIMTLYFAKEAGPQGRVIAFEPHPDSYERILEHVKLNEIENVTVRNIAVGSGPGELVLASAYGGRGRATAEVGLQRRLSSSAVDVERVKVPVDALDNQVRSSSLPDPDFVKLDVEGLEVDALRGMTMTIERCKPTLLVEIHGADAEAKKANATAVVEFLAGHGYRVHHVETDRTVDVETADAAIRGHLYCVADR